MFSSIWINIRQFSWYNTRYRIVLLIRIHINNYILYRFLHVVVIICIHSVQCVLYCVCSFVCCVSFVRGVILCDVCYLFVVSHCKPLPPGKNPFAVNKYYISLCYYSVILVIKIKILKHCLKSLRMFKFLLINFTLESLWSEINVRGDMYVVE
jgi:hypothetical protein